MNRYLSRIFLIGCVQIVLSTGVALATDHEIVEIIRGKVEQITSGVELQIESAQIASVTVLPELYEKNGFQRLWTNPQNVEDLFNAIKTIDADGLHPEDYHFPEIEKMRAQIGPNSSSDSGLLADYDLLLTDSLIRPGYHLIFGKIDPEDHHPHWNLAVEIDDDRPATYIQELLDAGNLAKGIEELRPQHIIYERFKSAFKKYRAFQANGGWEPVPTGPTLKKGMQDGRVLLLRKRLQITGDLTTESPDTESFDDQLEKAIMRFQHRHYLTSDGIVGKQTLEALNVPVENRIDQNKHLVFIHDTPSRSLFERTDRTFSSGCIRTEKPFELAQILLDNPAKWNQESFKRIIDSGQTQTVRLPEPISVLLFYWTAAMEPDGSVRFKKDPYKRDAKVLEALNGEFKFRKRPVGQKKQTL